MSSVPARRRRAHFFHIFCMHPQNVNPIKRRRGRRGRLWRLLARGSFLNAFILLFMSLGGRQNARTGPTNVPMERAIC